ncbi:MAG: hypothetical protein DRR08_26050 [Candidatus Parabeggiatoa sp. nov. 2]|nr:MAG: hypothetical protein B6247_10230 [Beggiatoa sp. 4572_84]RKZ54767.1 MAG: hypothetical protein DRR08_26050 [Gammaproteobacteria bacterium]
MSLAVAAEVDVFRVSNLRAIKYFGGFQIKLWPPIALTGATNKSQTALDYSTTDTRNKRITQKIIMLQ